MISEGGTSTTLCFSKNTGDRTYSLSVIPSVFEDCTTCNDLEAAVYAFGELHKKFFMDLYFQEPALRVHEGLWWPWWWLQVLCRQCLPIDTGAVPNELYLQDNRLLVRNELQLKQKIKKRGKCQAVLKPCQNNKQHHNELIQAHDQPYLLCPNKPCHRAG